jgi:hypothetical protein
LLLLYTYCSFFYTEFLISLSLVLQKKIKLNRGQVLAAAVDATGLNKEEVATKAGYSRSAYYKHISNPHLEYHILMAYGKAIRHDFTEEFPEMPKYLLEEPDEIYGKPKSLDEAIHLLDQWKNKYLDLLEKYKQLIEEKMEKKDQSR